MKKDKARNARAVEAIAAARAKHLTEVEAAPDVRTALELALRGEAAVLTAMFEAEAADFRADPAAFAATFEERHAAAIAAVEASVESIQSVVDAVVANTSAA